MLNRIKFPIICVYFSSTVVLLISGVTAINYSHRQDEIPKNVTQSDARTTRQILELTTKIKKLKTKYTLQEGTEHLLQFGALLRTQILDTFGYLVYDRYDDFSITQMEALFKVYHETLERKYNIFDIAPNIFRSPDIRPSKICRYINENVNTCLKESSQLCMNIKIHNKRHLINLNYTPQIYRLANIYQHFPDGFSLKTILHHLQNNSLKFTPSLLSGLLHNIQYDSFDDEVRTAERELIRYLTKTSETSKQSILMTTEEIKNQRTVSGLLKTYLKNASAEFKSPANLYAKILAEHVVREVKAISENIELLGIVYENNTINLKYLFDLILPPDVIDKDLIEAKEYLLEKTEELQVVSKYLRIEKYQQAGPDQLLMEILGQMRDIHFAVDIVNALHTHARFWHRSRLIEDLNELLGLFSAYENLRKIEEHGDMIRVIDQIKNRLLESRNVSIEISCSNPRACLQIGLQMVMNCKHVDDGMKNLIKKFFDKVTPKGSPVKEECPLMKTPSIESEAEGPDFIIETEKFSDPTEEPEVELPTTVKDISFEEEKENKVPTFFDNPEPSPEISIPLTTMAPEEIHTTQIPAESFEVKVTTTEMETEVPTELIIETTSTSLSTTEGISTTQEITTTDKVTTSETVAITTEEIPTMTEEVTTTEKVITKTKKIPTTTEKVTSEIVITTIESVPTTTEQVFTTTEQVPTTTEKVLTTTDQVLTTIEQVLTTTEQVPTTTEQVPTTTEQVLTTTEQVPTTTELTIINKTAEKPTTRESSLKCNSSEECSSECSSESCSNSQENCSGDDCATKKSCNGNECDIENCSSQNYTTTEKCKGSECPSNECSGKDCSTPKEITTCNGENCSKEKDKKSNCTNTDCLGEKEKPDCEGSACPEEKKDGCKDSECSDKETELKEKCSGKDCPDGSKNKTTVLCNNKDPHHRRKKERLQKMHQLDVFLLTTSKNNEEDIEDTTLSEDYSSSDEAKATGVDEEQTEQGPQTEKEPQTEKQPLVSKDKTKTKIKIHKVENKTSGFHNDFEKTEDNIKKVKTNLEKVREKANHDSSNQKEKLKIKSVKENSNHNLSKEQDSGLDRSESPEKVTSDNLDIDNKGKRIKEKKNSQKKSENQMLRITESNLESNLESDEKNKRSKLQPSKKQDLEINQDQDLGVNKLNQDQDIGVTASNKDDNILNISSYDSNTGKKKQPLDREERKKDRKNVKLNLNSEEERRKVNKMEKRKRNKVAELKPEENEDLVVNEDLLKNEDSFENEDLLKREDSLNSEDLLKGEDSLKHETNKKDEWKNEDLWKDVSKDENVFKNEDMSKKADLLETVDLSNNEDPLKSPYESKQARDSYRRSNYPIDATDMPLVYQTPKPELKTVERSYFEDLLGKYDDARPQNRIFVKPTYNMGSDEIDTNRKNLYPRRQNPNFQEDVLDRDQDYYDELASFPKLETKWSPWYQ